MVKLVVMVVVVAMVVEVAIVIEDFEFGVLIGSERLSIGVVDPTLQVHFSGA